mmetsp:Transcript_101758/g.185727  ORF Transcript_101758/g.185727 Transcript_101758/m.185727 type:complete len:201 (+) Transcript_101758:1446-2048(+)
MSEGNARRRSTLRKSCTPAALGWVGPLVMGLLTTGALPPIPAGSPASCPARPWPTDAEVLGGVPFGNVAGAPKLACGGVAMPACGPVTVEPKLGCGVMMAVSPGGGEGIGFSCIGNSTTGGAAIEGSTSCGVVIAAAAAGGGAAALGAVSWAGGASSGAGAAGKALVLSSSSSELSSLSKPSSLPARKRATAEVMSWQSS